MNAWRHAPCGKEGGKCKAVLLRQRSRLIAVGIFHTPAAGMLYCSLCSHLLFQGLEDLKRHVEVHHPSLASANKPELPTPYARPTSAAKKSIPPPLEPHPFDVSSAIETLISLKSSPRTPKTVNPWQEQRQQINANRQPLALDFGRLAAIDSKTRFNLLAQLENVSSRLDASLIYAAPVHHQPTQPGSASDGISDGESISSSGVALTPTLRSAPKAPWASVPGLAFLPQVTTITMAPPPAMLASSSL